MSDLTYLGIAAVFAAATYGLVLLCARLAGGQR